MNKLFESVDNLFESGKKLVEDYSDTTLYSTEHYSLVERVTTDSSEDKHYMINVSNDARKNITLSLNSSALYAGTDESDLIDLEVEISYGCPIASGCNAEEALEYGEKVIAIGNLLKEASEFAKGVKELGIKVADL